MGFLLKEYSTDQLEQILQAGEQERGTTIRVNTMQTTTEKFRNILIEKGIKVEKGYYNQTSLIISGYDYIRTVPGFHEGLFTVQDESSSLQVLAAGIRSGDVILDVCAAPGGKTMYAAEQTGERGHVYARDISEEKVDKIDENLERLELHNVSTKVWDAAVPDPDMIEKADVVLADLPCSGLGVMARKNDIKYHVTEDMVRELAAIQKTILDVCAVYVKPGGTLIYSTCTIDRIENDSGDLVKRTQSSTYKRLMSSNEANLLGKMMRQVVTSGTASALNGRSYTVAGKTGSAEFNEQGDSHSWFVGYTNVDNPELVIAVIVENGGAGSEAAVPIAGQVFDAYYAS